MKQLVAHFPAKGVTLSRLELCRPRGVELRFSDTDFDLFLCVGISKKMEGDVGYRTPNPVDERGDLCDGEFGPGDEWKLAGWL